MLYETNLGHKISFFVPRHVTQLTQAQAHPAQIYSGFAQACSPLLRPSTIFGALRRSMLNCFNSSSGG